MAVYLTAASRYKRLDFAESLQKQTACQLSERVELPYFKQFDAERLSLDELYKLIDEQIHHCLQQAGWQLGELKNVPLFLGSTGYVIADCEARLRANAPLPTEYCLAAVGETLVARYGVQVFSIASSCTSAAQGVHYAAKMLQAGLCEKALVVGFEPFNRLTFEHFHAMHLLADTPPYQPFQRSDGMVLGEGLACLALSRQPHGGRGVELLGITSLTDNENLTNNSEAALDRLIAQTLANANISAEQISLIKPHAVGGNFHEAEKALLARRFPHTEWWLAKAYLGHTLGASGAVETALLLETLQENRENRPLAEPCYALCYFLGFGGNNVGWVLKYH